jgi:Tfp pilus assembly protein PilF
MVPVLRVLLACFLFAPLAFAQAAPQADELHKRLQAGRAYYDGGKYDPAIKEFRAAVKAAPNDSWAHLWLARALGRRIEKINPIRAAFGVSEVRSEFERAVQLDPKNVEARSDLLDFYLGAPGVFGGGSDKARAQAEAIAKLNMAEGHSARARIAEKEKKYEEAEREYRAAIDANSNHAGYRRDLEKFWKRRGMPGRQADLHDQ